MFAETRETPGDALFPLPDSPEQVGARGGVEQSSGLSPDKGKTVFSILLGKNWLSLWQPYTLEAGGGASASGKGKVAATGVSRCLCEAGGCRGKDQA